MNDSTLSLIKIVLVGFIVIFGSGVFAVFDAKNEQEQLDPNNWAVFTSVMGIIVFSIIVAVYYAVHICSSRNLLYPILVFFADEFLNSFSYIIGIILGVKFREK